MCKVGRYWSDRIYHNLTRSMLKTDTMKAALTCYDQLAQIPTARPTSTSALSARR